MFILRDVPPQLASLSNGNQCIFVMCWYSLVHQHSLDSHRVRCMNARNILNEVQSLLSKPFASDDIKLSAAEALEILGNDPVFVEEFHRHYIRLQPLLQILAQKQKDQTERAKQMASYYLKDAIADLDRDYRGILFYKLQQTLTNSVTKPEEIQSLTGTLVSLLIDQGETLESLFSLLQQVIMQEPATGEYNVLSALEAARRVLESEKAEYEVIFRMTDWYKQRDLPPAIGQVRFSESLPVERISLQWPEKKRLRYTSSHIGVLYAHISVEATDFRTAGTLAKAKLDEALDYVRFELVDHRVEVEAEYLVCRQGADDGQLRLYRLPAIIPNPRKNVCRDDFQQFLGLCNGVLQNTELNRETKQRVQSALRFFRLGSDSPGMENTFLNWWTALEYFSRTGNGSIIKEVENRVTHHLVLDYVPKLLRDYARTLQYCHVEPSPSAQAAGVSSYAGISLDRFYALLADPAEQNHLESALSAQPYLWLKLKQFTQDIATPHAINAFLSRHEKHLRWHINRLYRLRCDIVHSAEYHINLALLGANLEFYLKSLVNFVLRQLNRNQCVESLDELFSRTEDTYSKVKTDLTDNNDALFLQILQGEELY